MEDNITIEGLNLLNGILPFLPRTDKFSINYIHAENVLKPQFSNGLTIDLTKYDPERTRLKSTYQNVTNFLIANTFALAVDNVNGVDFITLTRKGEYLKAYGSINAFYTAVTPSTTNEIELRITELITLIAYYGEFIIVPITRKSTIVDLSDFQTVDPNEALNRVIKSLEREDELISEYKQLMQDDESLQYLVDNGFAINRHDIKIEDNIYRQLTDKGRQLKDVGTIASFKKLVTQQEKKIIDNENQRINEQRRNKYLYLINLCLAIFTGIAAVYYTLEILRTQYNLGLPNHIFFK